MRKQNSTLKEKIVSNPPKSPKSFGGWTGLFEHALKHKIYPDCDVLFYTDDEDKEHYIKFTLLCQYVMQETAVIFGKSKKLNDELTEENSRLLIELDEIENQLASYHFELKQIQSTRLYKFFKWLRVW